MSSLHMIFLEKCEQPFRISLSLSLSLSLSVFFTLQDSYLFLIWLLLKLHRKKLQALPDEIYLCLCSRPHERALCYILTAIFFHNLICPLKVIA